MRPKNTILYQLFEDFVHRIRGSRLILTPLSVTDTMDPFNKSSMQASSTSASRLARYSDRRPSIRMRITDGFAAPEYRVEIRIQRDHDTGLLGAKFEYFRVAGGRQPSVSHVG
jgi:hypothetical protein